MPPCGAAVDYLIGQAGRRGKLMIPILEQPAKASGYIVLAMGKMGAGELNYSSDIDLIIFYDAAALAAGTEPAPFFVRLTRTLVKLLQERTARRLCVPHRPAAAARSGLDPDCDLDRRGARLLRKPRPELGTRRADQGAPLCRRHRGR